MGLDWAVVILYFCILIGLSYSKRKSATISEYLVSKKEYGTWTTVLATMATGESAWQILGLTGIGYALGGLGYWVTFGETFWTLFAWMYMAPRFKRLADKIEAVSVFDVLEYRFKDNSKIIRIISTIIIFFVVPIYLSAQFNALGKTFNVFFGTPKHIGILVGGLVMVTYTVIGGFKAISSTNVIQSLIMIVGILVVAFFSFFAFMNNPSLLAQANAQHWFSLWGTEGFCFKSAITAFSFFSIGLGFLGVPHLFARYMAAKDEASIRSSAPLATLYVLIGDSAAVTIGLLGRYLVPGLIDSEFIFSKLTATFFPPFMVGIMCVVALAATMSTADSLLILISTTIIRDVYQKLLNKNVSNDRLIRYSKNVMLIVSLVAILVAIDDSRLVFWVVLFAWAAFASAFNPIMILSVTNIKLGRYGVISGMISGFLTSIFWGMYCYDTGIYEMVPGFLVNFIVTLTVSFIENKYENFS